jgi:hypothetical protein
MATYGGYTTVRKIVKLPTCNHCGALCWLAEIIEEHGLAFGIRGICEGEILTSDDYEDGNFTHYCDKHGHPKDQGER